VFDAITIAAAMSFLLDPPLLYASGAAYGQRAPEAAQGRLAVGAGAAAVAAFWTTSVALYLERPWTGPLWRAFRSRSGRDFMLNSGLLRLDTRRAGAGTHALATLLFALYPVWFWLGWRRARR
jgi:hypothetical protein